MSQGKSLRQMPAVRWCLEHAIFIVLLLLFLERLLALWTLGVHYTLASDDLSYIKSGIRFAQTGMVTMHGTTPSAQSMPGMTWFIGLFAWILGDGTALWWALKLTWIAMGTATAWFLYKSVGLFAPKWCGLLACLPLFSVDFVWTDNLILTETPFILCLSTMIYCTFLLGKTQSRRALAGCIVSYLCALLLKANIALYPLFALGYLLAVKYPFKKLLKQGVILACAVLCFLVPWTIRNYVQFQDFVPLTYGAGNPSLLGTYQGYGYPEDDELDYTANVDAPFAEEYASYLDENGQIPERYEKYLSLQHDAAKASYRLHAWAEKDLKSLLVSYSILKPKTIINGVFYWDRVFHVPVRWVEKAQTLNLALCVLALGLSLLTKKRRGQILFLAVLYLGNVAIYAATFAFERYSIGLMPMRCLMIGFGAAVLWDLSADGKLQRGSPEK